jgi:hypothetical protein
MRVKLSIAIVLTMSWSFLAPIRAKAACSAPYENCLFDGCARQLAKDDGFESTNCTTAWIFSGGNASRNYSSQCGHSFTGPFNTWVGELDTYGTSAVYQDIPVPDEGVGGRTHLTVEVDLKTLGKANTYDKLKITIRNPSTNQVLETLGTINPDPARYNCQPVSFEVANTYQGQTIRLYLEATNSQLGTSFILDGIRLWLNPY